MNLPSIEELRSGSLLLVDKPIKWTSFDVIAKIRNLTGAKIGHAGTLDPLASGMLILCTGKKTKSIQDYMGMDKVYTGTIQLGSTTESYDLETEPSQKVPTEHIDIEAVREKATDFVGDIMQYPPMHSAIKKKGKRLYEYARKGEEIKVDPRPVHIESLHIRDLIDGNVHFEVKCSKGTYIRSLAHDLGQALGVGAYLSSLRREAIGDFRVEDAPEFGEMLKHFSKLNQKFKADNK